MKSKQLIIAAVLLLLLAGGGYLFLNKSSSQPGAATTDTSKKEDGSVFGSIKDALSKSLSLQCEYSDESGRKTMVYIKGGAIRSNVSGKTPEESGSSIVKDGKLYFWNSKEGIMMAFNMQDLGKEITPVQSGENPQSVVQDLEKYKENCKPATVDSSLFTPPSDVKFTDFSKTIQDAQKSLKEGSNGVSEEQIKELQKQFQNVDTQPADTSEGQ
ncbi:hypothetical protein C4559_06380 [Candidatus Microgenomates bacterium]|nr:MAG: hypothetical protein C4559_06380 [Candidatus Microgenomates bacterium]